MWATFVGTSRTRRALVALAIALVVVTPAAVARLAAPPPAEAQNVGGLVGQLLTTLTRTLCPIVTQLDDAVEPVPVVRDVTGLVRALVCNLGVLEYRFHTVWEGPGGQRIERTHNAVIGVPTPLNVDNKPGSDVNGTIAPVGLGLQLAIQRQNTNVPLAASVEAVIKDPTGSLGAENVAVGYDQLGDRVPRKFTARLDLSKLAVGESSLGIKVTQHSPGDDTDVIASMFDGTPSDRQNATTGRIEFDNSPTDLGIDLALGDPLVATLSTNTPGPVNATVSTTDGTDTSNFSAKIQDLPNKMTLSVGQASPRVVYTGTDAGGNPVAIDHLALTADSTTPLFSRATNLAARIDGLPSGTELSLDQASNQVTLDATQAIGKVELFAGSQPEAPGDLPPAGEQGARIVDRPADPYVIGARVRGLRSLAAGLNEPYTLHTETAGGPFGIEAILPDVEASIGINDLPTVLDLTADLAGGQIAYTGAGEIDEIGIDVASATPLFLDANEVGLLLQGVPTSFTLNLAPSFDNFAFTADNGIDKIEAKAKSPSAADDSGVLAANDAGAVLRKVGANTFVFARVFNLQELAVGLNPVDVTARMESGHRFVGDVILEQGGGAPNLDLDATIANLPSEVNFGLGNDGTGGSRIHYAANAEINEIGLNATGLELLPGADPLRGILTGIPREFTLDLPATGPVAKLNVPSGQLGMVRVSAGALALPGTGGNDQFTYRDLPGQFGIAGRLSAVRGFSIGLDPVDMRLDLSTNDADRKPIQADARIQESASDPVQLIQAFLNKPSASTTLGLVTAENQPTRMAYTGTSRIDQIDLHAENLAGLPLIDGHLVDIPRELDVCFDPGEGCHRPNPHNINRRETSNISIDIDDNDSSGSVPLQLTAADIVTEPGADPIVLRGIRLHELGADIGIDPEFDPPSDMNAHVFIDSDNRPFSIDRVTYDSVKHFALGTVASPASAQDRLVNLNGLGITGLDTEHRGNLNCGGRQQLDIEVLGITLNLLDLPIVGQAVPLCGNG